MTTNEEIFGAGIKLTQDFDLGVDNTGDIGFESGIDELGKDIAFQTKRKLDVRLGHQITNTEKEVTKVKARRIILQDERVESIARMELDQVGTNILQIDATIVADNDTTYDFVFEIGE